MDQRVQQQRRGNTNVSANFQLPLPTLGPKSMTAIAFWAFGLYVLFFAKALYVPTEFEEEQYHELMQRAVYSEEQREAERNYRRAQAHCDAAKTWFWRWRHPDREIVQDRQVVVDQMKEKYDQVMAVRNQMISEAKANVGLWSSYGVAEVRQRFWDAYESGKDFAKRMSFWDVMFARSRRDEELAEFLIRFFGQIMMNFTIGLGSALVSFTFSLVSMIWEYKASLASAVAFFTVAMLGATSMVAAFIGGMYGTASYGLYFAVKSAQNQQRLQGEEFRRQQLRQQQRRQHYE